MSKWTTIIKRAEKRRGFTEDERHLATDFSTCAISDFKTQIATGIGLVPIDDKLESLGCDFLVQVDKNDVPGARKVYSRIEKRVETLPKKYRSARRLKREARALES